MKLGRFVIITIGAVLCFSGPVVAQEKDTRSTKTISVCPFQLTPSGRTANFRFSFRYIVESGADGSVTKVQEISNSQRNMKSKLVRDDLFEKCLQDWRLEPSGRYFVSFYVGTTSLGVKEGLPFNYMRVLDPNKLTYIFELTTADPDIIRIDR